LITLRARGPPRHDEREQHNARDGKEVIFMSWQEFIARHHPGDVIDGVVTKEVPFGSFVESEGFTGLAHQQSWPAGTRVSVRILAIDPENQRFSLAPA
jgi:ribosomal protein S1